MKLDYIHEGRALRIAVGIMVLVLLLAGSAGAATLTVNASGGADYTRLQDAINNATNGDTIEVHSGTYSENVNVTKQLTLRGIGNPVVNAGGSGNAITLAADGIILEGFTATGAGDYPEAGIVVISSNNTLIGNNANGNGAFAISVGIYLSYSSNNTLIGNNANSNRNGVVQYVSGYGIYLSYSSNNKLSGNNADDNGYRPGYGIYSSSSSNNTLIGNNASGNGAYYGSGISLGGDNNTLIGNNAWGNGGDGISLSGDNNTLIGNNARWNNGGNPGHTSGIFVDGSNNTLIGNNASSNYGWQSGSGISLGGSNNTLIGNNASSNNGDLFGSGISVGSNNTLIGNTANSNYCRNPEPYCAGIILGGSNNTLNSNIASNNGDPDYGYGFGIRLESSSNNLIYNNIFNNTNNVQLNDSNINNWSITKQSGTNILGGPFLGGNFWAHPNGTGFSQTCPDSNKDGICDIQYTIDGENIDYLPLSGQFIGHISEYSPDSNTVLLDHFNGTTSAEYVNGSLNYVTSISGLHQAADFKQGNWIRYNLPGWYTWSPVYDSAGKEGTVEMWVYPRKYGIGLLTLQWYSENSPPSAGYILGLNINSDGKLQGGAWICNSGGPPVSGLPPGKTTIPLNTWTHVAYSWSPNGTKAYVNGNIDAESQYNLYPALNSQNFVYVNSWGENDLGYIDELRISKIALSFGVRPKPIGVDINITGVPFVGKSTKNILAADYRNFIAGDPYNITITRISDSSKVFADNGTLMGGSKQVIPIDWIPKDTSDYLVVAEGDTIVATNRVRVIDSEVVAPVPELSTIVLMSTGLLGLFGLTRFRRRN